MGQANETGYCGCFAPRGSTPHFAFGFAQLWSPASTADKKKKMKGWTLMSKPELSLQDKGYSRDILCLLNLSSLFFGCSSFFYFNGKLIINNYEFTQEKLSGQT